MSHRAHEQAPLSSELRTLLRDPRRAFEQDSDQFVALALDVLLDASLRACVADELAATSPAEGPEAVDQVRARSLAARVEREGLVALDPEALVEVFETSCCFDAIAEVVSADEACVDAHLEAIADTLEPPHVFLADHVAVDDVELWADPVEADEASVPTDALDDSGPLVPTTETDIRAAWVDEDEEVAALDDVGVAPQASAGSSPWTLVAGLAVAVLLAAGALWGVWQPGADVPDASAVQRGSLRAVPIAPQAGDLPPERVRVARHLATSRGAAEDGNYDLALAAHRAALAIRPDDDALQKDYDALLIEAAHAHRVTEVRALLADGDCARALDELQWLGPPEDRVTREVRASGLVERAERCLERKTHERVRAALQAGDIAAARDAVDGLSIQLPKSSRIEALDETITVAARAQRSAHERVPPQNDGAPAPRSDATEDTALSHEPSAACLRDATTKAEKARALVLGNPHRAVRMLEAAISCRPDPRWLAYHGFALERQGRLCAALHSYERALGQGLSGGLERRVRRGLDALETRCEP